MVVACLPSVALLLLGAWSLLNGVHAQQELTTGHLPFADIKVFYRMYNSADADAPLVVFLHGENYTSEQWVELGSMKKLREDGCRTIAVDLPGFGQTQNLPYIDKNMRAEFVKAVLEFGAAGSNITLNGAMLVTPSLSGNWAIPFLDRYGTMLKCWVALAPTGVSRWGGPWEDTHKKVRLLAMYGQDDVRKSEAENLLKFFSKSNKVMIPNANQNSYMEQPEAFHQHLIAFSKSCLEKEAKKQG